MAALRQRRVLAASLDALLGTVDALLLPGAFHTAPRFEDGEAVTAFTSQSAMSVFNVSGHPASSVCTGFDDRGLPTNAQIAGSWWDEATILRIAHAFETATPWRERRPMP
jgi:aspartyl-tRNA(Asn)/glutamyl-tRNA(Gln) amidotransferase subunit A